jgi:hypothetical protein
VLPTFAQIVPAEKWQRFSSSVAGFSVLMPGEPQESLSEDHDSPLDGQSVKVYGAHVGRLDEASFDAVESIYPQPIDGPNDVSANLDRFQSRAAKNLPAGRVVSQKDITVEGMPGRRISLSVEVNRSLYTMDQLFVLKGNRLFQLIAMGGSVPLRGEDVNRFLDSFTVTGPAKGWKRSRSDPNSVIDNDDPELPQVTTGVRSFDCPTYPSWARENGVQGMVQIQVTTDRKKITDLKAVGTQVLAQAAEENARTWKFAENAPTNFIVTYSYALEGDYQPDPFYKCRAELQLPNKVEVSTSR